MNDTYGYLAWLNLPIYNIRAIFSDRRQNFFTASAEEAADQARYYSDDGAIGVYTAIQTAKPQYAEIRGEQPQGLKTDAFARVSTILIDLDVADTFYRQTANDAARMVSNHFVALGWPQPWVMDSGNGSAVLWRVDLPVDTALLQRVGEYVASLDIPPGVKVDLGVYDLARIYKLPGTMNRKFDPILAQTLICGSHDVVTQEQLEALVGPDVAATQSPLPDFPNVQTSTNSSVDTEVDTTALIQELVEYLHDVGVDVQGVDGNKIKLETCPGKGRKTATTGAPVVYVNDDGSIVFDCYHTSCQEITWADLQEKWGRPFRTPNRPQIKIRAELHEVMAESIAALAQSPNTYQRGGILVEQWVNPEKPPLCVGDNGAPRLRTIPAGRLACKLSAAARYQKSRTLKGKTTTWIDADPPANIVKAISEQIEFPGVPQVTGLAYSPMLRSDGSIVRESGYDPSTGLILDLDGSFPESVPLDTAKKALDDILQDFPWESEPHKSGWLACLVTLVSRHAIRGNTPFFLFDANVSRAGKGLATDVLAMIIEGRRATRYMATTGEEMRKAITSIALSGSPYLLLDNIRGRLGGQALENALTTGTWTDRLLGGNTTIQVDLDFSWLGTSNNAHITTDMVGRSVHVQLNSPMENPGERTEFIHPDLLSYVKKHRHTLAMCALAIPSAYMAAGRPPQNLTGWGGFDDWSDLVRGSLVFCGYADPDTRKQLRILSDDQTESLLELMDVWGQQSMSVSEAFQRAGSMDGLALLAFLDKLGGRDQKTKLGVMLRDSRNRVVDGRRFITVGVKPKRWKVEQV